jgi:putative transposase
MKDRRRYLQWLYQARKRYGFRILNYMVTCNHVHLLVADDGDRDVIPNSMKLAAGRTGQEYNQRKNRKGAYWEDRYHATAVESGDHLARCMVCIDTNMVRAGVIDHPSQWPFSGYNEIQKPKRKNILIAYDRLAGIFGSGSYDRFRSSHRGWVAAYLGDGRIDRKEKWTNSIAVGNKPFVEKVKGLLGFRAKGRKITKIGKVYQVREVPAHYNGFFEARKEDIGPENYYLSNGNIE